MATEAIGSNAQIGIQDFLRILVAQLNNQDPLKPLDNQEFVTQLAQFTSLQQTQELNDRIGQLLSIQASTQSIGLIGRSVDVSTQGGNQAGKVSALAFVSGEPRLTVTLGDGTVLTDISLSNVVTVR